MNTATLLTINLSIRFPYLFLYIGKHSIQPPPIAHVTMGEQASYISLIFGGIL